MKILGVVLFMLISGAPIASSKLVPVIIGQRGPEIDACPSSGKLSERSSLRKGPGQKFDPVSNLDKGTKFHVCGASKDGKWTSVILAQDGFLDCQASSPTPKPHAYSGPCASGWLPTEHVEIIAG